MTLRLLLLLAILALNGFFAAAEVALVSVRRSKLAALGRKGNVAARAALELLSNPERLLSVTQVGVTLASLGLGWAGEETLYELFLRWLGAISPGESRWLHAASFTLGFLAMSFCHVVVGEVVPKNLAIDKADRLALLAAPALLVFHRLSAPFVFVVERAASAASKLIGVKGHGAGGHSAEELKFIVEASRREGHLEGFEEVAIQKLLELKDVNAREIMTPRVDVVSVPITASLDELLRLTIEHKYSRLPVYESQPEHIIGVVHYKDLVRAWMERKRAADRRQPPAPFLLRRYIREPLVVPETKPLNQLIDEFRHHSTYMAMVVDEFGTIVGVVTLHDILSEIFGAIGDEHDGQRPHPVHGAPVIEVDGNISIRDLASQYGIELPGDAGFQTLAGFLLFRMGFLPTPGDAVAFGGRQFFVEEMERNRIAKVKIVTEGAAIL